MTHPLESVLRASEEEATHAKFLARIEKRKAGCWEWTAGTSGGYGQIHFTSLNGEKGKYAHRYSYEHFKGEIPSHLVIDHICNNRRCVNPKHLRLLTNAENVLRGVGVGARNAKKKVCANGHPYTKGNTVVVKVSETRIKRKCRACVRVWNKKREDSGAATAWRIKNADKVKGYDRKAKDNQKRKKLTRLQANKSV